MVQQPVHGRGGEGFRHDGVGGVDVAGHRDGAAFVGGVGDPVERFGGVLPCPFRWRNAAAARRFRRVALIRVPA